MRKVCLLREGCVGVCVCSKKGKREKKGDVSCEVSVVRNDEIPTAVERPTLPTEQTRNHLGEPERTRRRTFFSYECLS
jgi:hypothetical protein